MSSIVDVFESCSLKAIKQWWVNHQDEVSMDEVQDGFNRLCELGNLKVLDWFLTDKDSESFWRQFNENGAARELQEEGFVTACQYGHKDLVRYFLTSQKRVQAGHEKINADLGYGLGFRLACLTGQLDIVKYLLTSTELKKAGQERIDLHQLNEEGLSWACKSGCLELVKYLLTSNDLIRSGHTWANLNNNQGKAFEYACCAGHVHVVKYLLDSMKMREAGHESVHLTESLMESVIFKTCECGQVEMVNFLLQKDVMGKFGLNIQSMDWMGSGTWMKLCMMDHRNVLKALMIDHGLEPTPTMQTASEKFEFVKDLLRVQNEQKELSKTLQKESNTEEIKIKIKKL